MWGFAADRTDCDPSLWPLGIPRGIQIAKQKEGGALDALSPALVYSFKSDGRKESRKGNGVMIKRRVIGALEYYIFLEE
jgi:hypothetical protein